MKTTRSNRHPVSLSFLAKNLEGKADKIAVAVTTVLDDERLLVVPKMRVCALKFSESARSRIRKAGGTCMTFDQLALSCPTGANTLLFRGNRRTEARKHFGLAPGQKGSHTKPYVRSTKKRGRKCERHHGLR